MSDLILFARLARMYRRRGWTLRASLGYARALVYAGVYRP